MAQALPARPNLDWLRKTAKQSLRDLRVQKSEARLAEAQMAVARNFGFSSWRALKAHVDKLLKAEAVALDDSQVARFLRDVRTGNNDAVRVALKAAPALVNANGPHPHWGGRPQPLHMAIEGKNREAFDLLLAAGADISALDRKHHGKPADFARVAVEVTKNPACAAVAEYLEGLAGD